MPSLLAQTEAGRPHPALERLAAEDAGNRFALGGTAEAHDPPRGHLRPSATDAERERPRREGEGAAEQRQAAQAVARPVVGYVADAGVGPAPAPGEAQLADLLAGG